MQPLERDHSRRHPRDWTNRFLGAGKTTLLDRILTGECGEIGIDNHLIVDAEEEIFEMINGCIRCTSGAT